MRATRQVCLQPDDGDGVVVTVRELTIAEVRSALITDEAIGDWVQSLVFDGFGLGDLLALCDASAADLEKFTPSELAPLVAACRELNPFFFRVRAVVSFRSASEVLAAVEQMSLTAPVAS